MSLIYAGLGSGEVGNQHVNWCRFFKSPKKSLVSPAKGPIKKQPSMTENKNTTPLHSCQTLQKKLAPPHPHQQRLREELRFPPFPNEVSLCPCGGAVRRGFVRSWDCHLHLVLLSLCPTKCQWQPRGSNKMPLPSRQCVVSGGGLVGSLKFNSYPAGTRNPPL